MKVQIIPDKKNNRPTIYQPREKLDQLGLTGLSEKELWSLVIGSGQKKQPLGKIAQQLCNYFQESDCQLGNLKGANKSKLMLLELSKIKGLGRVLAARVLACCEIGRRFYQQSLVKINSPQKVFLQCLSLRQKRQEYCLALFLNGQEELIDKKVIAIGSLNFNFLELRVLFERAFQLEAASFILAHNHPSGQLEPSAEDLFLTEKLTSIAELMGVKFLDHIIIGRDNFLSIREKFAEIFTGEQ